MYQPLPCYHAGLNASNWCVGHSRTKGSFCPAFPGSQLWRPPKNWNQSQQSHCFFRGPRSASGSHKHSSFLFSWRKPPRPHGIINNRPIVTNHCSLAGFLRVNASRWVFLGGNVQEIVSQLKRPACCCFRSSLKKRAFPNDFNCHASLDFHFSHWNQQIYHLFIRSEWFLQKSSSSELPNWYFSESPPNRPTWPGRHLFHPPSRYPWDPDVLLLRCWWNDWCFSSKSCHCWYVLQKMTMILWASVEFTNHI